MTRRLMKLLVLLILLILYFQLISNIEIDPHPSPKNNLSPDITNNDKLLFQYENHTSFYIQGNYELELIASQENWNGDGSESNPYMISGYKVNGSSISSNLLWMNQTDLHCKIINNMFVNANKSIIHLENVSNIEIIGNYISNGNSNGIAVKKSNNVNISMNTIYENNGNGTIVIESANITINNNSLFNNNGNGIALVISREIVISYNTIFNNNVCGINLENSIEVTILENRVYNMNNYEGIVLFSSENNSISGNVVYNNSRIGIAIFGSNKNEIVNNVVFYNHRFGILIEYSNKNTISSNIVYKTNYLDGIQLYFAEDNNVSYNTVYGNTRDGILLYSSTKNLIANNMVYWNSRFGIAFYISPSNDIFNNIFYRNDKGIELWDFCNWNRICYNVFCDSTVYDISINSNDNDNNISQNDFHSRFNGINIFDNGERNIFTFNYFSNWITPDIDVNKIVDTPFTISGSASNQDPSPRVLPQYHVLMPPILISPIGMESFSKEITLDWEPSFDTFNHEITYSLYCSSDGGITWNTIVDQLTGNTYLWNISSLMNGQDYMIKVAAICSEESKFETVSDKPFTIMNHFLSPIVLSYPEVEERLNGIVILQWKSVNDSLGHQIKYAVYFSSDNGISWTLLAQELTNTSYEWDTTIVEDGSNYKVMIVAQCEEGESTSFNLDGNFIIQNTPENPIVPILLLLFVLGVVILLITGIGLGIYRANLHDSVPVNLEGLQLGICFGSLATESWEIVGKNDNCSFEDTRLLSMIEFSAVSYKHGEFEQIYGPFPQIMTPDSQERQCQFISFSFQLKDNSSPDSNIKVNAEKNQVLLLIYYEKQYEILINSRRKSIKKYLSSLTDNFVFSEKLLEEIESRIVEVILRSS